MQKTIHLFDLFFCYAETELNQQTDDCKFATSIKDTNTTLAPRGNAALGISDSPCMCTVQHLHMRTANIIQVEVLVHSKAITWLGTLEV